jgi:hypothetical protein
VVNWKPAADAAGRLWLGQRLVGNSDRRVADIGQVGHVRPARARGALLVLLRAINGALVQPVGSAGVGAELGYKAGDIIAPMHSAGGAFDAQHL